MNVKVWTERISIPTYEIGVPEKNPIFLEKRVYQGSSGKVYPFPVVEKISDKKVDKEWLGCFLENNFLKIMILPELGGRVQMAYDKVKERHFVYYNEVIKPGLVGLTGPWISGGIEFNWPQHHRPSTYSPVDHTIEEHADGSKTVWCSEIERMSRTKGMTGFKLYPDKAYLEINVKLYNRTALPQTFLWWANPAVAVNDAYHSVFPPDVNAVYDHGKRDVSDFPIATGTYYKFDYSPGTDISRYKNIPVPTSYMAIKSGYNFVGGYENDTKGGLLHIANHHVSPGKKQWTWGSGDFGKAWDRNLTDNNGPYIELMCGVYTDNQPDFSWLMPYEEKTFSQYFMPYQDLGVIKNASKEAMVNLEFENSKAIIKIYATGIYNNTKIRLMAKEECLLEETFNFRPGVSYVKILSIDSDVAEHEYHIAVVSEQGALLVDWAPEKKKDADVPKPAEAAKLPKDITTNEELFLTGQHLEQYRHATYDPADYYKVALARDESDVRCNNAMGKLHLRNGKFEQAGQHFLKAYEGQIRRNPNPYDGEPLFNLGISLRYQGMETEAYAAFYKSVWNAAYMDSGYFQIAQIDAKNKNWDAALENIDRSLVRNSSNHKARHLKVSLFRKKQRTEDANDFITECLKLDLFNFGLYFEKYLLGDASALTTMKALMRDNIHNYIETALDYGWAGLFDEALQMLQLGIDAQQKDYPMAQYYKAWFLSQSGKEKEALIAIQKGENCSPDYCFPNRLEAVPALEYAVRKHPESSKASYYLGNFWYDARQYRDAVGYWEKSVTKNGFFPTAHRNLAISYYNKSKNPEKAIKALKTAFELDTTDARVLMELDQLQGKLNTSIEKRVKFLEKYPNLVEQRDDTYLERVNLKIIQRKYSEAYELIMARKFHPWEGGEGKVTGAYRASLIGLAKADLKNRNFSEAIDRLKKAKIYPGTLGEGKLQGAQDNDIDYWLGCAYDGQKNNQEAKEYWKKAVLGDNAPSVAWFYNDQRPDAIFYQSLALLKLGEKEKAFEKLDGLIGYGEHHFSQETRIDYFAVSLPNLEIWDEDLNLKNKVHCLYLMALGYKGKGLNEKASEYFQKIMELDNTHLGARENYEQEQPVKTQN